MYENGQGVPKDSRRSREVGSEGCRAGYCSSPGLARQDVYEWRRHRPGLRRSCEVDLEAAQARLCPRHVYARPRCTMTVSASPRTGQSREVASEGCRTGHGSAISVLAGFYSIGIGVPQDYVKAHKWFNVSAIHSTDELVRAHSLSQLREVESRMTLDQIAEARKLASEWKPKAKWWVPNAQ